MTTPWRSGTLGRGRQPRILFGWSYEDERIELAAFGAPGPDRRVCVIAAAGETAAACATAGFDVTAVDINPRQLQYARSRAAGGPYRPGLAERGMAVGRAVLRRVAPAWRPAALIAALADADPSAAGDHWNRVLDRGAFPPLLRALVGPGGLALRALDPELAASVPPRFDQVIRRRIGAGLTTHGFAHHRFAWRLLLGHEHPGWTVPAADRHPTPVRWTHADVAEHLEAVPSGHYVGISLSNVLDGAGPAYASRLRTAATRALAPGGAIVLRSFGAGDPGQAGADASLLWGRVEVVRPA